MTDVFFINGKKYTTDGKTLAQLEHMLQLARDDVTRYQTTVQHYPQGRMERCGVPHLTKLQSTVAIIEKAIQDK